MEAQINDIRLYYRTQGQGVPVLLVHGFPLSGEVWQEQIEALHGTVQVIVPDLRGFGRSDVPDGPSRMETFADDLSRLLDTLHINQVVIGGVSMGGYITFAFLRHHHERVRGLIFANTRATPDTDEARTNRETTAQLVEAQGAGVIADTMLPKLLAPSEARSSDRHTFLRSLIERNSPRGIAAALRGMALRPDSSDLLPHIQVPTLIIAGDQDVMTPPAEMQHLHAAIPGSRLVELAGAGHVSNIDQPEGFNAALRDFLSRISA
ncbi:MAG: alpha/beta fold hydrolase [Chloroflexaceae bacterium]|nr:alpha/beta fold hydrolase [Chloroflexaceae bacterium]